MSKLEKFIHSFCAFLEIEYLKLFDKKPDHSKQIQFRYEQIKHNISMCKSYRQVLCCRDMINRLLTAPYGEEAMLSIDKLTALLNSKQKSIERRARIKNGEDLLETVFKTA